MLVFYMSFVVQVRQGDESDSYKEQECSKAYFFYGKLFLPGEPAVLVILHQAYAIGKYWVTLNRIRLERVLTSSLSTPDKGTYV